MAKSESRSGEYNLKVRLIDQDGNPVTDLAPDERVTVITQTLVGVSTKSVVHEFVVARSAAAPDQPAAADQTGQPGQAGQPDQTGQAGQAPGQA